MDYRGRKKETSSVWAIVCDKIYWKILDKWTEFKKRFGGYWYNIDEIVKKIPNKRYSIKDIIAQYSWL